MTKRLVQGPAKPVWLVDASGEPIDSDTGISVSVISFDDGWVLDTIVDIADDDSNKEWDVPAGEMWQILWVYVQYTSTAGAGNRQLAIDIEHPGAALGVIAPMARAGATQAASLTYHYFAAPGSADLTALRDTTYLPIGFIVTPMLTGGDRLRIWDNKAIAAAADDMHVAIRYARKVL